MADAQETVADIIAEMRALSNPISDGIIAINGRIIADRLEAAHKREVDALKQRCTELNAEVAAKDEVIKRLDDAIAEEQRRKMATAENQSAVGNAAKLREALESVAKQLTDATEDENFGEDVMYLVGCMRTMSQKCRVTLSTTSNQNT